MKHEAAVKLSTVTPRNPDREILSSALAALRKMVFQFFLPLIVIGPVLIGAEKLAELFGFHGTSAQFIRIIMMGVYALIIFTMVGSGQEKSGDGNSTR